jgi:hypothetical protein
MRFQSLLFAACCAQMLALLPGCINGCEDLPDETTVDYSVERDRADLETYLDNKDCVALCNRIGLELRHLRCEVVWSDGTNFLDRPVPPASLDGGATAADGGYAAGDGGLSPTVLTLTCTFERCFA